MRCKQCHAEISIEVAGETTRMIKRYCEVAGMTPEAATSFTSQRGPLCRDCMQKWDQREETSQEVLNGSSQPPREFDTGLHAD